MDFKKYQAIKNWPESERPGELLLDKGTDYVSNAGLVAILLRTDIKGKDTISFTREILKYKRYRIFMHNA